MEKALQNLEQLLGTGPVTFWRKCLAHLSKMADHNRLFSRISESRNKEELTDHLAAVRYAIVFSGLGFEIEIEPLGGKGPDLGVSKDGHKAFVEVTRLRKNYPGPPPLSDDEDSTLAMYGDLDRDIQRSWSKIEGKFTQVGKKESIIALWNDDEALEEIEVEQAARNLRGAAAKRIIDIPDGLAFLVYGCKWIGPGPELEQQFHCFPFVSPPIHHHREWMRLLEGSLWSELMQRAMQT